METVELTELRDRLEEFVQRFENGEELVLTHGGRWVATLTAPPEYYEPPTPEEVAIKQAVMDAVMRELVARRHELGIAVPESYLKRDAS